jgi:hypothetical protein
MLNFPKTKKQMPASRSRMQQLKLSVASRAVQCSPSVIVPSIMLQQDIMTQILEKLEVKELLLCSLVCRVFLRRIDANMTTFFNKSLRWWSVYDATYSEQGIVKYNSFMQQYEQLQQVNLKWMHKWLLNNVPYVGAIVHMRMHLQLALDRVDLTGKEHYLHDIRKRGFVSVDALEWEILEVKQTEKEAGVCKGKKAQVQMQVISFVHNNKQVSLKMLESIIVTFEDVPIPDKILPLRVLFVIKSVRLCMHCFQRSSKWQSVDNVAPEHRVLCNVCMEELYVEEKKLHTKWKILPLPLATEPEHFCFVQREKYNFNEFYLKKDVAAALGHENWAQMLKNNRLSRKRRNKNNRFDHFDFHLRWFA